MRPDMWGVRGDASRRAWGPKKKKIFANVAMLAAVAFLFASVCFGLFVVLGWVRSVLVV